MARIFNPASYVPPHALAYAAQDGSAQIVGASAPLPVGVVLPTTNALSGVATASGNIGPFTPVVGRSVLLSLWGNWSGTVQVMRSTDGGTTLLPLTIGGATWAVFTTNCCEAVWDESEAVARLYLGAMLTSGTLNYRLAQ